jgi:hypothetical protein
MAGDTATFTNAFSVPFSSSVIVVNGNARFDNLTLDLSSGAFIVNGNLILGTPGSGMDLTLRVPTDHALEYLYTPTGTIPCHNLETCSSTVASGSGGFQFRGLLFVNGDLLVNGIGWKMAGAVLVGNFATGEGRLIIESGTPTNSLAIFYDENIGHMAEMNPLQLQIDGMREVSVR